MKHELTDISGIGASTVALLAEHGIDSVKALSKGGIRKLMLVPGFGQIRAERIMAALEALMATENTEAKAAKKTGRSVEKEAKKSEKKSEKLAKKAAKKAKKSAKAAKKEAKKPSRPKKEKKKEQKKKKK